MEPYVKNLYEFIGLFHFRCDLEYHFVMAYAVFWLKIHFLISAWAKTVEKMNFTGVEIATLNLLIKIQYPEFMDSEIVSYEYLILRVWGRHGYFSLSKVHGC